MSVKNWSTTPGSNASVDSINFAEGQVPSGLNDSARQLMADVAEWYAQIKGGTLSGTVGGSGETMTLTTTPSVAAYSVNQRFLVRAPGANTSSAPTLNVSSLGTKIIKSNGLALPVPAYLNGDMLVLAYDGTDLQLVSAMRDDVSRNPQTGTTYTITEADRFKHVTLSNASAVAVTLPQSTTSAFVNGWSAFVENIGAGVVTITPTTSTINSAATLVLAKGQWAIITADGANYRALVGGSPGVQTVWVPAGAMVTRTTAGAQSNTTELTTNRIMVASLDFDATTQEHAQFSIRMPKGWDEGTVTAEFLWSHAATTTNFAVVWGLQGSAYSDNEALDIAFGTAQEVTDTGGTTSNLYKSPTTAAITIGATPSAGDLVIFQVYRKAADGADTLAIDARLHGVTLFLTYDTADDR